MNRPSKRWTVLAMMFLIGLAVAMQVQSVQALAPFLVDQLGFSYAQIGVLLGLFMLPGVFVALPGGMLAARLGDRITMAIALTLVLVSALTVAAAESYAVMVVARLVGGIGGAVLTTQPLKVVTDWFAGREISTAMATNAASFGLGIGLSTGLLSAIAAMSSWQGAMLASAVLVAVALFMVVFNYSDPQPGEGGRAAAPAAAAAASRAPARATRSAGLLALFGLQLNRHEFVLALLAAVLRMCFASGYVVFMSFAPVLLIARGTGAAQAGFLVSLSALAALISVPLGGADRPHPQAQLVHRRRGAGRRRLLPDAAAGRTGAAVDPELRLPARRLHRRHHVAALRGAAPRQPQRGLRGLLDHVLPRAVGHPAAGRMAPRHHAESGRAAVVRRGPVVDDPADAAGVPRAAAALAAGARLDRHHLDVQQRALAAAHGGQAAFDGGRHLRRIAQLFAMRAADLGQPGEVHAGRDGATGRRHAPWRCRPDRRAGSNP
ncbi:MAG: MFS transporter [Betaproteobacteria bacterium]|nr:MFS transporter [Betaproteobacteria bacterium]